jgi:type II secretory pathway predicted ATPase ExeA/phage tail protein X
MPTAEYSENATGGAAVLDFFGLRKQPFGVTPDPEFLYLTASHREALASLIYGIESKRGFSALIAEPGMGKTTLLFYLLEKLKTSARTAFLFRPDSNTKELLESLLLELGLAANPDDVPQMHETLKSALLEDLDAGKHFVWVIDEAQDLDASVLEAIRLLSNFETPASKLMHILLAGQPGLSEKLEQPELVQLRQRISTFVQLAPLSANEVSEYMRFRIRKAGGRIEAIFSKEAQTLIAEASLGIPRMINSLCFASLSLGFAEGQKMIRPEIVREVLVDRQPDRTPKEPPATPQPAWPDEFFNASSGPDFVEPVPQNVGRSFVFFVIGLIVLPLSLVILESSSRLGALEAIRGPFAEAAIERLTGYNIHLPPPPASLPVALQPPKPPVPLPEPVRYFPATNSALDETETNGSERVLVKEKETVKAKPALPPREKQESLNRVIFAHRGDTLYELARKYYGTSNGALVERIKAHNPHIPYAGTVLQENQPVVLPNLAPEFPWKIARSGGAGD